MVKEEFRIDICENCGKPVNLNHKCVAYIDKSKHPILWALIHKEPKDEESKKVTEEESKEVTEEEPEELSGEEREKQINWRDN